MLRVIINADDFGFSREVNDSVVELMKNGRITSATLLANSKYAQEAVESSKLFPHCSFGVHLALTEVTPVCTSTLPVFREAGMLDENGNFNMSVRGIRPSRALKEAAFEEWSSQVERCLEMGADISHFDSHHQAHTIPWLMSVFKRIQRKFGVTRARPTMNWYYRPESSPPVTLLTKKWMWNTAFKYWYSTKSPRYFTSFRWMVLGMEAGVFPRCGVVEAMTHPGQPYSTEETQMLWTEWREKAGRDVCLISYRDL